MNYSIHTNDQDEIYLLIPYILHLALSYIKAIQSPLNSLKYTNNYDITSDK